jgi:hypothetical protein
MTSYLGVIDDEEANAAIEDALGIRFQGGFHLTVGDLEAWAISQVALRPGVCATSMAFYQLRRAFGGDRRMRPPSPIGPLLGVRPKAAFVRLERDLRVTLPGASSWLSVVGGFSMLVAMIGLPLLFLHLPWQALVLAAFLGILLQSLDPGRRPAHIETVGDLATAMAALNLAKMGDAGAAVRERDVQRTVREVMATFSGRRPDEITPEVRFGLPP